MLLLLCIFWSPDPYLFYLYYIAVLYSQLNCILSILNSLSSLIFWWRYYVFSHLQDLINSNFSPLLPFTLPLLHSFHFKIIIFNILIVLLYIFPSPGPYPFYLWKECNRVIVKGNKVEKIEWIMTRRSEKHSSTNKIIYFWIDILNR